MQKKKKCNQLIQLFIHNPTMYLWCSAFMKNELFILDDCMSLKIISFNITKINSLHFFSNISWVSHLCWYLRSVQFSSGSPSDMYRSCWVTYIYWIVYLALHHFETDPCKQFIFCVNILTVNTVCRFL